MLQSFRDNLKGVTAFIIVGIIIIPFAFWGVESLFVSGSSTDVAATVNGEDISELDVLRATELQRQRILSQFQDVPPLELSDEKLREPVLDQLIRARLLEQFARSTSMGISDQTFNELVAATEAFQVDGRFDATQYEYLIGQQGFTPNGYRKEVKNDLLVNQLTAGLQTTGIVTDKQLERFSSLVLQERSWDYITLPLAKFIAEVTVSDEEVAAYFKQHNEEFREPDKVVVDYIEVTPEIVAKMVDVDEDAIKARFEAEQAAAVAAGSSWHLAHILVTPKEDGTQKELISALAERLKQGEEFDQLARESSEDFGSAENGGDIGVFTEDAMPPEFIPAVQGLSEGDVSVPVETASGFHLIKLLSKNQAESLNIQENRQRITQELRLEKATEKMAELVEKLKEAAYNAESLVEVGALLDLPVQQSAAFSADGGPGVAQYPQVLEAAFSEDVKELNYASEVLDVGDKHHVVIKLNEFNPSHVPGLEQVKVNILATLKSEKAAEQLTQKGTQLLDQLQAGTSLPELATQESLIVANVDGATRFDPRADSTLVAHVFNHPSDMTLPINDSVSVPEGQVIYVLTEIVAGSLNTLSPEERKQLAVSINQLRSVREFQSFANALQEEAELTRRN